MRVWIDDDGDIVWFDQAASRRGVTKYQTPEWTDFLRDGVYKEKNKNGYDCLWMILK